MKLWSVLIGVLVLSVLAVGCGGGSGGDETIAKAEFVDQASTICERAERQRNAAVTKALADSEDGKQVSTEQLYRDVVIPILARMGDELAELDEPNADAETATAFVTSFQEGVETMETEFDAAFEGKIDPLDEAGKKAEAYGLEACTEF